MKTIFTKEELDVQLKELNGKSTCGEYLNHMVKRPTVCGFCVHNHIEHNRCAAEMRDSMIANRVINRFGRNIAATDNRATQHRHHPRVVPAVAVKQRHDLQIGDE